MVVATCEVDYGLSAEGGNELWGWLWLEDHFNGRVGRVVAVVAAVAELTILRKSSGVELAIAKPHGEFTSTRDLSAFERSSRTCRGEDHLIRSFGDLLHGAGTTLTAGVEAK